MIYVDFTLFIGWDASLESILSFKRVLVSFENSRRVLEPNIGDMGSKHCLRPILLNIGHLGSLGTKTPKNVLDVRKLVLRVTSEP